MHSSDELQVVIKVAREGDLASFEQLVKLFERRIFGFVFRHLNSREDAEDVTQEVFIKLYRKIGSYDPAQTFSTWLFTIATNAVYDHLRRRRARPQELLTVDDPDGPLETADPRDAYTPVETSVDVSRALERVRPVYQTVLLLYYRDELSCEEIGRVLGVPVGTVKTHLFRARRELKEKL